MHADSPLTVSVFEIYKDEEAVKAHEATEHFKELFGVLKDALEGELESIKITKGELIE